MVPRVIQLAVEEMGEAIVLPAGSLMTGTVGKLWILS